MGVTEITQTSRSTRGATVILSPIRVNSPADLKWQECCDVLVIGWGAAGACSALEANAQGADVLVVDRFTGGGASAKSGGVVYAGGGTRQQKQAGFQDTPEAMFEYLKHEVQGVISDKTLRRFCEQSVTNLAWLEAKGAPYSHEMPPGGKTSYPPDGYYLYYSGNEQVPAYQSEHAHAPRGHRTVGKGHGGAVLYHHLQQACLKEGVRDKVQSVCKRLVIEKKSGRVVGAELHCLQAGSKAAQLHKKLARRAEKMQNLSPAYSDKLRRKIASIEKHYARPMLVQARQGVVLSTGGFIFNRKLVKEHAPKYRRNFKIGATGCDGSGLRLGLSAGADKDHLDQVSAWRFINPPAKWPKGLVVNARGERFCNEEVYGATLGYEICEKQEGKAWLILDKKLRWQSIKQCLFGGYWWFQSVPALALMLLGVKKGKNLSQLADACGMESSAFKSAVSTYNQSITSGQPDPMGKSAEYCQSLEQGPYYAMNISVGSPVFPLGALTLGGLKVSEESGQVLNETGQAIPGLYAAGRTAIGVPSNLYVSGLSLADCVFSGRRAGLAITQASDNLTKQNAAV